MADSIEEKWIQVRHAIAAVAGVYHEALRGDFSEARAKAIDVILIRLSQRKIKSQSRHFFLEFRGEEGLYSGGRSVHGQFADIPMEFWEILRSADSLDIEVCDWVAGEFDFYRNKRCLYRPGDENEDYVFYPPARGYAVDVRVSLQGVPFLAEMNSKANKAEISTGGNRPPGRPKGSGGWSAKDAPIVEKMRQLILENPGMSPHGAAGFFVDQAAGNASFERKQRRLAESYRKAMPVR